MKINSVNSVFPKNSWRTGVTLAFLCLSCLGLSQSATQLKDQKRITSLQIGEGAEGSRVTIVSDSALADYEAFRRGDRFYVRIPQADFAAAQPAFDGNGFDDVQVQRVGNSIVISFKLQPGARARVDQRSNRLDVIFSSPTQMARNNSATSVRSRVISSATDGPRNNGSTMQRRASDAAGPVPPDSPNSYDARVVPESTDENRLTDSQTFNGRRRPSGRGTEPNKSSGQAGPVQTATTLVPSSSVPPSTTSAYPPVTSATPLNVPLTTNAPASTGASVWAARSQMALRWVTANRLASLIGSLTLLGTLALLVVMMGRRRKIVVRTRRANMAKVQPKYSPDVGLEEMLADDIGFASPDASFDMFVDKSAEWETEATFTSSYPLRAHMEQELRERVGRLTQPSFPSLEVGAQQERPWESVDSAILYSGSYENLEEHEREVIEL